MGKDLAVKTSDAGAFSNIELEQRLLGTLLAYPEAMYHIGLDLRPEHFADAIHQKIFEMVREGVSRGEPVSPVTLAHKFDGQDARQYLVKLVGAAQSMVPAMAAHHADAVRELAMVRVLQAAAREVLEAKAGTPVSTLTTGMADAVMAAQQGSTAQRPVSAAMVTESILADVRSKVQPTSTGIRKLDNMLQGGLYPGKMYGLGARKKTGKTTFLGTISYNLNYAATPLLPGQSGKHLFICGEMGAKEIQQRSLARRLDVAPAAFLMGEARPVYFEERLAEEATYGPRNALYLDAPGISLAQLKQAIAVAVAKHKIDGFMLDYWQLVTGGRPNAKTEHLDEVAQYIAQACKQYGIWALVSAQINREGAYRGGDGLQNAADLVMTLGRCNDEETGQPDPTSNEAFLRIEDSRYTPYASMGNETKPGLIINGRGPFFEEYVAPEHLPEQRDFYEQQGA